MKLLSLVSSLLLFQAATASTLNVQPDEFKSKDGLLDVTLTVDYLESLEGARYSAVYNGSPVGPTLRVKPGDTLRLTLENNLPPSSDHDRELYEYIHDPVNQEENLVNTTLIYNRLAADGTAGDPLFGFWGTHFQNVHIHGADLNQQVERPDEAIDGGETRVYEYEIPKDQEPGLHWYHNHVHGTSGFSYMSGLAGLFIIESEDDVASAPGIHDAKEVLMVLSEFFPSEENATTPDRKIPFVFNFGWDHVTNGRLGHTLEYTFEQGESALFRVASASSEPNIPIQLDSHELIPVGYDGFPAPSLKTLEQITIAGGQRVEFMVEFGTPGTYLMRRKPWAAGITGVEQCNATFGAAVPNCVSYDIEKTIAIIKVLPSQTPVASTVSLLDRIELPAFDTHHQALAAQEPVDHKTVTLEMQDEFPLFQVPSNNSTNPFPFGFGMNGNFATPFGISGDVQAGECETWDIVSNPPFFEHPFHIHGADFLVTHQDGIEISHPKWRDTEIIQGHNMTIHICFDRAQPGDVLLAHCHMAGHQDVGMMTKYRVIESQTTKHNATRYWTPERELTFSLVGAAIFLLMVIVFITARCHILRQRRVLPELATAK